MKRGGSKKGRRFQKIRRAEDNDAVRSEAWHDVEIVLRAGDLVGATVEIHGQHIVIRKDGQVPLELTVNATINGAAWDNPVTYRLLSVGGRVRAVTSEPIKP